MPRWFRLNSSGVWQQLSRVYRLNDSGVWQRLSKIYRLRDDGSWGIVHVELGTPSATVNPTLLNQNSSATNFYAGDSLTLTKGSYTEVDVDTTYRLTIYRGLDSNASINDTNWEVVQRATQAAGRTISFAETVTIFPLATQQIRYQTTTAHGYSVGDIVTVTGMTTNSFNVTNATIQSVSSTTQFSVNNTTGASGSLIGQNGIVVIPVNSITYSGGNLLDDEDAYNKYYYLGQVRVTNDGTNYNFITPVVLSRISFTVSGLSVNPSTYGGSITWGINGITSTQISSGYLHSQTLEIRLGSSTGTLVQSYSVPATATSYTLTDSTNILPNTTYHARIVAIANDGWKLTESPTSDITGNTFTTLSVPPTNTVAPTIVPLNNRTGTGGYTGYLPVSTTLTADKGTWTNVNASTTYEYDWFIEDSTSGALSNSGYIGSTRTYSVSDVNDYVFVRVRATNSGGGSATAVSGSYILHSPITVSTMSPTTVIQNQNTNFTGTITNYPARYIINWGDGTSNYDSGNIAADTTTLLHQ